MSQLHLLAISLTAGVALAGGPPVVVVVPEIAPTTLKMVSRFAGGYLIDAQSYCTTIGESKIRLFHVGTKTWREFNPWPADEAVAEFVIKEVVPLKDGRVIVGQRVISPDNRRAEVVAIFDASGRRTNWFRTNPFAWDKLAVHEDGSLWMFGHCPDYLAESCGKNYPLVRHYALDGRLLDAFLLTIPFRPVR